MYWTHSGPPPRKDLNNLPIGSKGIPFQQYSNTQPRDECISGLTSVVFYRMIIKGWYTVVTEFISALYASVPVWDSHLRPQQWNVVPWSCWEPWWLPPGLCRWGWAKPECSWSRTLWVRQRMSWSSGSKRQQILLISIYSIEV